jgi:hypothetical protein
MALFGIERWSSRADAFGVAFALYARLAPAAGHVRLEEGYPVAQVFAPATDESSATNR